MPADNLASGSDQLADLVGGNLQGEDARSVGRENLARRGDHGDHLVQDVEAGAAGLLQRFLQDGVGDVGHLDIHLKRGDAGLGSGDLEVHIAVVILGAGDVGEHGVSVAFLHQTHGDAGHGRGDRHAGVHQRKRSAADGGHGTRSIGFQNVADDAHGVGEGFVVGNDGGKSALGQCAVADFTAARAAHEADFADAERREVVVQHEALGGFRGIQQLNALLIVLGAESGGDQRLGFSAREERGAVGARQHADLDIDLADLIEGAAIGAAALLEHLVAEDAFP